MLLISRSVTNGLRTEVTATVDGAEYRFVGPATPGYPGPAFLLLPGWEDWSRVDSPERFGDTFGHAWVAAFFGRGV